MENLTVDQMIECMYSWSTHFLQNNMLMFFEDLFRHVLQETEGLYYSSGLDYLPLALSIYQESVGLSIKRILTVAAAEIDQFFESIKMKIRERDSLKIFLARLVDKFLRGPPEQELYFLTVISRFFVLVYKSDVLSPDVFTEEVAKIVVAHASKLGTEGLFPATNAESLLDNILATPSSIDTFRTFKCGKASDYFS